MLNLISTVYIASPGYAASGTAQLHQRASTPLHLQDASILAYQTRDRRGLAHVAYTNPGPSTF